MRPRRPWATWQVRRRRWRLNHNERKHEYCNTVLGNHGHLAFVRALVELAGGWNQSHATAGWADHPLGGHRFAWLAGIRQRDPPMINWLLDFMRKAKTALGCCPSRPDPVHNHDVVKLLKQVLMNQAELAAGLK